MYCEPLTGILATRLLLPSSTHVVLLAGQRSITDDVDIPRVIFEIGGSIAWVTVRQETKTSFDVVGEGVACAEIVASLVAVREAGLRAGAHFLQVGARYTAREDELYDDATPIIERRLGARRAVV